MQCANRIRTILRSLPTLLSVCCLLFFAALPYAGAQERKAPGPVQVEVKAQDGTLLSGVTVFLGGRYAPSGADGRAVFDGVPEGKQRLAVEHIDYDAFRGNVDLAAGVRRPLGVKLNPVVWSKISGKVLLEGAEQPLPGVRVSIAPKSVKATLQGPVEFMTGWDGAFVVSGLPPGVYKVELSHSGCAPKSFDLQVAPNMQEVSWSLAPLFDTVSLTVTVRDGDGGKEIPGARVVLAEAWPRGEIAQKTTDASGSAAFAGLKIGRLNRAGADGRMTLSRSAVTVRAEADGYEPMLVPVLLGRTASVEVQLNSAEKIAAQPGNLDFSSAQRIRTGAPVEFVIENAGENKFFRFHLPYPAWVGLDANRGQNPWLRFHLHAADGTEIGNWGLSGESALFDAGALPAGEYVLQAREWNNNKAATLPMTFTIQCRWASDPHSPNAELSSARAFRTGEEVRGYILPRGDRNHFRFEIKRPGQVRLWLQRPENIWIRAYLFRSDGAEIANLGCSAATAEAVYRLDPGAYVVDVREWNNNAASLDPYTLRIEEIEDDGMDDAKQEEASVRIFRPLPIASLRGGTIFPQGDRDWYQATLPSAGVFKAFLLRSPSVWQRITLFDTKGVRLTDAGASGPRGDLAWHADGPATVFLQVREWNDNAADPSPYILGTFFEPCDQLDAQGRNDSPDTASPLELNEWTRGNLLPNGDNDWFRIDVDHPGILRLEGTTPPGVWVRLSLHGGNAEQLADVGYSRPSSEFTWENPVLPGAYFIRLREWNNNASNPGIYSLRAVLQRSEPEESVPLAEDAVRTLTPGEARPFFIDHGGDRDVFLFDIAQQGPFWLKIWKPGNIWIRARLYDDRTGAELKKIDLSGASYNGKFEAEGPTRYRLELGEWNNNAYSVQPGFIQVRPDDAQITADEIKAVPDAVTPTLVTFTRSAWAHMQIPRARTIEVDATGDGKTDFSFRPGDTATWRYPAEGLYKAAALMQGEGGATTRLPFWVDVSGPRERTGIHLTVDVPGEGQRVEDEAPARARAMSYSGSPIARIEASVDGTQLPPAYTPPYTFEVPWKSLPRAAKEHLFTFKAVDGRGESATVERRVSISEYFGLRPADGAVLSGNQVRVSWSSGEFSPTKVRYRAKGTEEWTEIVGESGREHAVFLEDLESGTAYEFQPLGGSEEGPVRTLTRVKGLAFGKSRYGASIERTYDQRFPISVRNHAEEAMKVVLTSGKLEEEGLFIGFVGEGSEGEPFDLAPGEEREFLLVLNAQNAVKPKHVFPVKISSANGFADEAEVEVEVRLPVVKLEWEDLGEAPKGPGRRLRLVNRGDSLTDLSVFTDTGELKVSPAINHGFLPSGQSVELTVTPRLYEGFREARGAVTAKSIATESSFPVHLALPEGKEIFGVNLMPKMPEETADEDERVLLEARALSAAFLTPDYINASMWGNGIDSNGDGRIDRWSYIDQEERILWVGEDASGDGEIDFVRADVGFDGRFDYSALKGAKGWEETNLLDAWLEMTFTLPWNRGTYEPHDLDIVMNGQVIGTVKNAIPEGNYRFPVPASAIRFGASGEPEGNGVEIVSRHLRGGHYVVNSDFRLVTRLNAARAWTVAESREEAEAAARSMEGVIADRAKISISSQGISLPEGGSLKAGAETTLTATLRNLGAMPGYNVGVVLSIADPNGTERELRRSYIPFVPVTGEIPVRFTFSLPPGKHRLKLSLNPDNRPENSAYIWAEVGGDDQRPTLDLLEPADGAKLDGTILKIKAHAMDDVRVARVEAKIDQGLWSRLQREADGMFTAKGVIQPGERVITVRALDGSGNVTETTAKVVVEAPLPDGEILEPVSGSTLDERHTMLKVRCEANVAAAAYRVNQGPWTPMRVTQGAAEERVALRFGKNEIEVRLLDAKRAERVLSVDVTSTGQRAAEEDTPEKDKKDAPEIPPEAPEAHEEQEPGDETPPQMPEIPGGDEEVDSLLDQIQELMGMPPEGETPPDHEGPEGAEDGPLPGGDDQEPETAQDPGTIDIPDVGTVDVTGPSDFLLPAEEDEDDDSWLDAGGDLEEEEPLEPEEIEIEEEGGEDVGDEPDDEEITGEEFFTETDLFDGFDGLDEETEPLDLEAWVEPKGNPDAPEQDPMYECPLEPFDAADTDPSSPFTPPSGLQSDPGGCVAVETVQKDWYCTNRPNINVKFQLPDWLKKLDLPKPGTKEYDEMVKKLLQHLRDRGIDTAAFERFQDALIRRAGRLEHPDELPTFLQSLGLTSMPKPSPDDVEANKRWREAMENGARAWYLRLLASGDPQMIYQGLKARGEALGKFDEALGLAADAMMTEIKANQQLTEQALWSLPYVGPAMDVLSIITGETLSGEAMTPERAAMMLGLRGAIHGMVKLGPKGVAYLMNTETGKTMLSKFAQRTAWMGPAAMNRLSRLTGMEERQIRDLASWTWKELTKERHLWGNRAAAQAGAAGGNFAGSQAGQAAKRNAEKRIADGKKLIDKLQATTKQKEFRKLALQLQQNKTAVALANDPSVPAALRAKLNKTLQEINRRVDKNTARGIVNKVRSVNKKVEDFVRTELPQAGSKAGTKIDQFLRDNPGLTREDVLFANRVESFLRKNPGMRREDILVRSRTVSGVDPTKLGRDRDVYFQFVDRRGKVLGDVHHDIAAPIYNQKLQAATGLSSKQLDHTVTSTWHPDSYNPGRMASDGPRRQLVDDIVKGRAAGKLARPQDIRDTVAGKAKEWFDDARRLEAAGNPSAAAEAYAEGMRQLGKAYERHVAPFLRTQNLDPAAALPPRLKAALDIFKKVEQGTTSGAYTPEQGLRALQSLSCRTPGGGNIPMSPDKAAEDLGLFIEMMNKWMIQGR